MKGDDQAAAALIQPVMGHHHHQHPHHSQQLIINKSPQSLAMDPHPVHEAPPVLTLADNISSSVPVYNTAGDSMPVTGGTQVPMQQFKELEDECLSLRDNNLKMKQQLVDSQRRERLMMRRLAAKEQELLDYVNQVAELKSVQTPAQTALKTAMLDPAVNVLFQKLKQELQATQARLEETQNELAAWKFTPDSNTGKRLMAKCRLLHQENEELGKLTSNGRLAKLESELAMQKGVSEDLKKSHCDLDEVLLELEEDVEGMQNTILLMQRELKVEKERNQSVERENGRMLTVLRDKPEWLAAVQARQEEATAALAAAERLKLEQDGGERRLNGGGCVGGMDVDGQEDEEETSGSAEPMDTATTTTTQIVEAMALRTRSGGVQVEGGSRTTATGVDDEEDQVVVGDLVATTNGKAEVNNSCISGINNNGQSMTMATRKRTRSSVAVVPSAKSVVVANCGEEAAPEQEERMPSVEGEEEVSTNCGLSVGKRNRYNNSNSDQQQSKSAPRTRGQLLQMNESEKAAPTKLADGEEVMMLDDGLVENGDGGGGGGEAGGAAEVKKSAASEHVLFCNNNNTSISNNGSSNKAAGEGVDENGTGIPGASVEAMKLKLENGGAAAAEGIDLRQENTSV